MLSNIIDPDTVTFGFPAPNLFPPRGGRRGVQLGDLGYFDDSGEFRPIFNIFHSYEQNIAEGACPPSPPYHHLHIDRNSVRQLDIKRQQTYTSSNIEKGEGGPRTQNLYQFQTYKQSGRSGAIIVLPHGGSSSCICDAYFDLPDVKRHFREHAPSWYQHALKYIPKKTNGSLILVHATHCARSWGIAAFASKRDIREPLTATFVSNPAHEYQHMWQTNDGKWETSTGPSSEELRELGNREPPLNQCIGAVISSLRLDDATWQANFDNSEKRRLLGSIIGRPTDIRYASGGDDSLSSPSVPWGWGLHRKMSRVSWHTSHVDDNSGRPTEVRHATYGSDDYTLLSKAGQERTRSPEQNSSSRQDPQAWETDTDYWVGGYRGETDDGTSGPSWAGESPRPSRWDSSFNQYISTTGQPISPSQGRLVQPPPSSIVAPPINRVTHSYPPPQDVSRHGSAVEEADIDAQSFTTTGSSYSQQTRPAIQPLGNPCLVPFVEGKGNENLGLGKNIDSHITLYMRSNIIDPDTIAFWFPAPTLYRRIGGRRGVQLGDLGYFDGSGEFHSIFNIFHSYEQNIAEGANPPSQLYQYLYIDRNSIRQVDIQRQQTYTSTNIEKRGGDGPHTQNSYQFRTYKGSGRSGAIIVLPHGGSSSCIRNAYFGLPEVKRHFREHALSWYQHALQYMPKKTNGSLILVRATHCAKSWGIAAFASKRDIREPLTATFMSNPAYEYQHMWQTNDSKWKTTTGPSSVEFRELGGREPPLNQCIGAVISSLRLDDATWQANFESFSSPSGRGGGWGLSRVENSGKRKLLDSIMGRPTEMRHAGDGGDDYDLLVQ